MRIEDELSRIIEKHNLKRKHGTLQDTIFEVLKKYFRENCENSKIIIVGAGEQGEALLKLVGKQLHVVGFVDDDYREEKQSDYPVLRVERLTPGFADTAIISTFLYKDLYEEKLKRLDEKGIHIKVINPYTVLWNEGFQLGRCFWEYGDYCYEEIIFQRNRYQNETDFVRKGEYLAELILSNIKIRDFIYTMQYIDEYRKGGYGDAERYSRLGRELQEFISSIGRRLSQRKQKDLILIWNDQACYDDLQNMSYLSALKENSLFFERAYNNGCATEIAAKAMFRKKLRIDNFDEFYERITTENSETLALLLKHGYDIQIFLGFIRGYDYFDLSLTEFNEYSYSYISSNLRWWSVINSVLDTEAPVFALMHAVAEVHIPFYCPTVSEISPINPRLDWFNDDGTLDRIRQGLIYWDRQLEFYMKLFNGENQIIINMSDHGKPLGAYDRFYREQMIHVIMMISGQNIKRKVEKKLFGLNNFCELLQYLLEPTNENYNALFSETVLFQDVDRYNEMQVKKYIEKNARTEAMAYRGVVSDYDKYVILGDKTEFYYILPDEESNRISSVKYQERIGYLRNCTTDYFLDIYHIDKFKFSRLLYEEGEK